MSKEKLIKNYKQFHNELVSLIQSQINEEDLSPKIIGEEEVDVVRSFCGLITYAVKDAEKETDIEMKRINSSVKSKGNLEKDSKNHEESERKISNIGSDINLTLIDKILKFAKDNKEIYEITDSKGFNLLFLLFGSVIKEESKPFVKLAIEHCEDINRVIKGENVIQHLAAQNAAGPECDLTDVLDELVTKGFRMLQKECLNKFYNHSRSKQALIPSKLAVSLIQHKRDFSLAKEILLGQIIPYRGDIGYLEKYLKSSACGEYGKALWIAYLIKTNNDIGLKGFLHKLKSDEAKSGVSSLQAILNHKDFQFLHDAVQRRHTQTFELLVHYGCDPLRQNNEGLNPLAFACVDQGTIYVESYLNAIQRLCQNDVFMQVINPVEPESEAPLTAAVKGRAYLKVVELLIKNGADLRNNYLENLNNAITQGDVLVFQKLLEKGRLTNESLLIKVMEEILKKKDPLIANVFNSYLLDNPVLLPDQLQIALNNLIKEPYKITKENLPQVCGTSSYVYLEKYFDSNSDGINDLYNGRTLLYHAIEGKAYGKVIELLLNKGANPNIIISEEYLEYEDGKEDKKRGKRSSFQLKEFCNNVVSLAVIRTEPEVLKMILTKAGSNLDKRIVQDAASKVTKLNDAVMTNAFISSLDSALFKSLDSVAKKSLLRCAIEANDIESVEKLLVTCPDININSSFQFKNEIITFMELAIKNGSLEMVTLLSTNPKILKEPQLVDEQKEEILPETMPEERKERGSLQEMQPLLKSTTRPHLTIDIKSAKEHSVLSSPVLPSPTIYGGLTSSDSIFDIVERDKMELSYLDIAIKNALNDRKGGGYQKFDPSKVAIVKALTDAGFKSTNKQEQLSEKLMTLGVPDPNARAASCCSRVAESCVIL